MKNNYLAIKTLRYIWQHPNSRQQKITAIFKFFSWQINKRLTKNNQPIQLLPNIKLHGYPDSAATSAVYYCGLYDYNEMNFLLRYLRAEDSVLDIGANIGVYTLLAASIIKTGTIHSFEVLPKNYQRLIKNIQLNQFKQIKTYNIAISDQAGEINLNLQEGDSMPFITEHPSDQTINVPANTLDNLLDTQQLNNLTLAKIDIEGAELLAFKGAVSLFSQQLPAVWIMEINNTVNRFNHQKQDIVNFLNYYGYNFYSYNAVLNQLESINIQQQQGNNILAIANNAINLVKERLNCDQNNRVVTTSQQLAMNNQ